MINLGQGHLLILAGLSSIHTFERSSSRKPLGQLAFTWEKVTTRSQVSVYRTNDPMVTIAAIDLKHDQDGCHTLIWLKKKKKKKLCPVTVFVDSQVSNHCPWAIVCCKKKLLCWCLVGILNFIVSIPVHSFHVILLMKKQINRKGFLLGLFTTKLFILHTINWLYHETEIIKLLSV